MNDTTLVSTLGQHCDAADPTLDSTLHTIRQSVVVATKSKHELSCTLEDN
jgi:hypothetical protein